MTTTDDEQRMWPVSERGTHLCFKDMSFTSSWREVPHLLRLLFPSHVLSLSLSFCLCVCLSLPLVLSLSHRLALLTGEWVVCWAGALSGTGANCKQKTLKGNKRKKFSNLRNFELLQRSVRSSPACCVFTWPPRAIIACLYEVLKLIFANLWWSRGLNTLPHLF